MPGVLHQLAAHVLAATARAISRREGVNEMTTWHVEMVEDASGDLVNIRYACSALCAGDRALLKQQKQPDDENDSEHDSWPPDADMRIAGD